jgi:hypothetical protein
VSDEVFAMLALVGIGITSCFTPTESKEILLAIASGIVGWMSREQRQTD